MYHAIRNGGYLNNGDYYAKSTLMGIMAREAAYTGQEITWDQIMNSKQDFLDEDSLTWETELPEWKVARPGETPFV